MRKAVVTAIAQMFELLMLGVIMATFAFVLPGKYANIVEISEETDTERQTISSVNVLISHPSLTYSDGEIFWRGILDKNKLDSRMETGTSFTSNWQNLLRNWEQYTKSDKSLSKEMAYPDTVLLITVLDLDSNNRWITYTMGEKKEFEFGDFINCMIKNKKADADISRLFALDSYPWEVFDISDCDVSYSKIAASYYGLPVSIRYSDDTIHSGLMRVWMVEK